MILVNGHEIKPTIFPDKTSQVWKLPSGIFGKPYVTFYWRFEQEAELLWLAQARWLFIENTINCRLVIDYLPYARQDKPVSNDATFALEPFATMLNALEFDSIEILDPHSTRAVELIKRSSAVYPERQISEIATMLSPCEICYPDSGAKTKYTPVYGSAGIVGTKVRDQATGFITSYELHGDPRGKNILIVDDICDGGATFKILAKALHNAGAASVSLFVTHGLFTQGLKPLFDSGIKYIFDKTGKKPKE